MPAPQPKGPFCQSCGMPLESTEDFGTKRWRQTGSPAMAAS
jgi:hypothetical protein